MDLDERFVNFKLNAYMPEETAKDLLAPKQEVLKSVPQNLLEQGLESAGINLEQAAQFLENLGSVNVGGIDFTLRDLLPVDKGTTAALKTAGSGMPLTVGGGLQTRLKPEFGQAATELSLVGPVGTSIAKTVGKIAVKNKAKIATGAAITTATQSSQGNNK
jgi:hypothetical protein